MFYDSRCYKTVVSQNMPEGLVEILKVPARGWEDDYNKALEDFNTCVAKYKALIDAENQYFKDIEIYKD